MQLFVTRLNFSPQMFCFSLDILVLISNFLLELFLVRNLKLFDLFLVFSKFCHSNIQQRLLSCEFTTFICKLFFLVLDPLFSLLILFHQLRLFVTQFCFKVSSHFFLEHLDLLFIGVEESWPEILFVHVYLAYSIRIFPKIWITIWSRWSCTTFCDSFTNSFPLGVDQILLQLFFSQLLLHQLLFNLEFDLS